MRKFVDTVDLRVEHTPDVTCDDSYMVEVENIKEAEKIKDILLNYDLFQREHNIISDKQSCTSIQWYDKRDKTWNDLHDDEYDFEIK